MGNSQNINGASLLKPAGAMIGVSSVSHLPIKTNPACCLHLLSKSVYAPHLTN